jgi:hypothetical protein
MKLAVFALLLLVAPAGGAQAPTPTAAAMGLAHRLAGCYRLDEGPWRSDSVRAGDILIAGTPLLFELTDRHLPGPPIMWSSDHPLFEVRPSNGPWVYWQRAATTPDTILLRLPFAGFALTETTTSRDLVGKMHAFSDAIREGKPTDATVYARRVACPPAPEVTR